MLWVVLCLLLDLLYLFYVVCCAYVISVLIVVYIIAFSFVFCIIRFFSLVVCLEWL